MRKKPYMSKNRLFLGGKRKQKGGFFSLPDLDSELNWLKKYWEVEEKKKEGKQDGS